jgi:hypothetical protein
MEQRPKRSGSCRGRKIVSLTPWLQPGGAELVQGQSRFDGLERVKPLKRFAWLSGASAPDLSPGVNEMRSVLRHAGIDLVRPCIDSAFEIVNIGKAALLQQSHCLGTAAAAVAMDNDWPLKL